MKEVKRLLFSVPHVHFILGVNLKALENSVHARYGDRINNNNYLKKFIDVTLEMPVTIGNTQNQRQANLVYLQHLIDVMDVPDHIADPLVTRVKLVSKCNQISMREIGKIVSSLGLLSENVLTNPLSSKGRVSIMIDLIITKNISPDLYEKFLTASLDDSDLQEYIGATETTLVSHVSNGDDTVYNDQYNHDIYMHYLIWKYILGGEPLEGVDRNDIHLVERDFNLRTRNPLDLPRHVQSNWIDQFSFFAP